MASRPGKDSVSSLGYALMCLLARRDRTGYELSQFTKPPRNFLLWSAGHSQIYPELARLARAGLVDFAAVAQGRRPDKKIYHLTEAGRKRLTGWILQAPRRAPFRDEIALKSHASWLADPQRAAEMFREQAEIAAAEIVMIEAHRDRLESQNGQRFPPPADHPLFGVYANVRFAIASRRQVIEWCRWMERELLAVAETRPQRRRAQAAG